MFLCSGDSLVHIHCWCPVVHSARVSFFQQQGFTSKLVSLFAPLAAPFPDCLPFPLCISFLIDVPLVLVNPLLAFNFAVWKFRVPSLGTAVEFDNNWRSTRIAELASTYLRRFKLSKKSHKIVSDDSIASHDAILASAPPHALFCYTDGSASPNPGPSGAGASIFNSDAATVTDLGANLGFGTNNLGELVAIGVCLEELRSSVPLLPICPSHVFIFTDSLFASNAVVSAKAPAAHATTIKALRALFSSVLTLVPVTFHWIRGHSGAGGNERVDKIAKNYATLSVGLPAMPAPSSFVGHRSCAPWPFSVSDAPLHLFLDNLPKAVSCLPFPLVPSAAPSIAAPLPTCESDRPQARVHQMRLRERPLRVTSSAAPAVISPAVALPPVRLSPVARLFDRLRFKLSGSRPTSLPVSTPRFVSDVDPNSGLDYKHSD